MRENSLRKLTNKINSKVNNSLVSSLKRWMIFFGAGTNRMILDYDLNIDFYNKECGIMSRWVK